MTWRHDVTHGKWNFSLFFFSNFSVFLAHFLKEFLWFPFEWRNQLMDFGLNFRKSRAYCKICATIYEEWERERERKRARERVRESERERERAREGTKEGTRERESEGGSENESESEREMINGKPFSGENTQKKTRRSNASSFIRLWPRVRHKAIVWFIQFECLHELFKLDIPFGALRDWMQCIFVVSVKSCIYLTDTHTHT